MSAPSNAARAKPEKIVGIVDRAARIVDCFDRSTPELTLPQISSRLGLPKPTAFRILANLVHHGLLAYNGTTNVYTLGFATLRLADTLLQSTAVRSTVRPAMQAIRDETDETVVLSIREGDHRINIDSVESGQAIAQTLQLGVRIPLYAGAASHVLLAGMGDKAISDYLARTELVAFNPTTLTKPEDVRKRVAKVREQGFAVSYGEFTPTGGSAIAVPVRDRAGATVAALHISGPKGRLTPELQKACLKALQKQAKALAKALDA